MYKIVKKKELNAAVTLMEIEAPFVARKAKAGQFIIFRIDEMGERVPLTIAGYDREKGTVTIIFQKVGFSTNALGSLNEGDYIQDFVGPLGKPTPVEGKKRVCVVGGGVGCAIALPSAAGFKAAGAEVDVIIGFRNKDIVILVATSGDTGKAALDGFADVPGVKIIVFYPENGVSAIQKLQMTTQTGNNVSVCAIKGNFDDAQTGVKNIFSDPEMIKTLSDNGLVFSSANSINFGRLVPQIIYYVSAYCDLLKAGKLAPGEKFNVAVPTGNFGNILAAVYAKRMGIPVNKFICASNKNRILTDFIRTGTYDRNREFYLTSSPSMDILISSNLERMLYHLYDGSCSEVAKLMDSLKKEGKYSVSAEVLSKLQSEFWGGFCDDEAAEKAISKLFNEKNMLCDTHTAVAVDVVEQYRKETGDDTLCVMASTASAYKFAPAVLPAVFNGEMPADGFKIIEKLSEVTATPIPAPLAGLDKREVLHKNCVEKSQMAEFILKTLLK